MKLKPEDVDIEPLILARRRKGWSDTQLAAAIGKSQNMVYKIERGIRTSERTIYKMCDALGVPYEVVFPERPKRRRRAS